MNLPFFLETRDPLQAKDVLHATSMAVLGNFLAEGLLLATELEHGYEDLPHLQELAWNTRQAVLAWHVENQKLPDFEVLSRGFVHAVKLGLDTAVQIVAAEGEELRLDGSLEGVLEGHKTGLVGPPLDSWSGQLHDTFRNIFTGFQDQCLVAATMTRDPEVWGDFYACGCLWGALAGVEIGLLKLDSDDFDAN